MTTVAILVLALSIPAAVIIQYDLWKKNRARKLDLRKRRNNRLVIRRMI